MYVDCFVLFFLPLHLRLQHSFESQSHNHQRWTSWVFSQSQENWVTHGGRRSIRSVARSIDRVDRFDRFGMIFDFLETSGSSRSVWCQSFSSVRRLEAEKTPKNQNEKIWIFGQVRFGRFDNPFDSIDNVPMGDGGPPWSMIPATYRLQTKVG